jgi:pyruvate formate lyase activating enzyme
VIEDLLEKQLVDMVALDVKTTWERYDDLLGVAAVGAVKQSLAACRRAMADGRLTACEIVVTLFRGARAISRLSQEAAAGSTRLQQGVAAGFLPLTRQELEAAAAPLGRYGRIRTREEGEVAYDRSRNRPRDVKHNIVGNARSCSSLWRPPQPASLVSGVRIYRARPAVLNTIASL